MGGQLLDRPTTPIDSNASSSYKGSPTKGVPVALKQLCRYRVWSACAPAAGPETDDTAPVVGSPGRKPSPSGRSLQLIR